MCDGVEETAFSRTAPGGLCKFRRVTGVMPGRRWVGFARPWSCAKVGADKLTAKTGVSWYHRGVVLLSEVESRGLQKERAARDLGSSTTLSSSFE